jgi:putative transport protein
VLRTFGLTLFLAAVGMRSGEAFVATVRSEGLLLLLAGAAITLAAVVTTLVIGHFALRMPLDELFGVASGLTGNPAILAFAARSVPAEQTEVAYAITFPSTTILKLVIMQLLVAILARPG